MVTIGNSWDNVLKDVFEGENYQNIRKFLKKEYSTQTVFPDMHDIFNAFRYTSYDDVKVVILGQDPYHGRGQAHGLAFSVQKGVTVPPSLQNIFKCIACEYDLPAPTSGNLSGWAKQGVLLLNTVLTVREGLPNSHKDCGWELFTDNVIEKLNQKSEPLVFLLWGANAKSKKPLITNRRHLVLEACHPSPLSAVRGGFFSCGHFSKANAFLKQNNNLEIDWGKTDYEK